MKTVDLADRLLQFNQGRQPQLLRMKFEKMRANAFVFLCGTCHLFYEDWPADSALNEAPRVWLCGDLHLENFGSYKGDNRLVYFDLNDFDETVLAPCTWDLARLLTSILVGAKSLDVKPKTARRLCEAYLDAYTGALAAGRARWVERETAEGLVKGLLAGLRAQKRKDFLNGRTKVNGGHRRFRRNHPSLLAASAQERKRIKSFLKAWAAQQANPKFFKLLDVARRIAGTASLGVERYVLLVKGRGGPHENYLLDLKEMRPSALQPLAARLNLPQPRWPSAAARVVAAEQRVKGTPPALLTSVNLDGKAYVLRELQPTQDRVNLEDCAGKLKHLQPIIETMGELTAWGQLRSGGRQSSAIAEELIGFAQRPQWRRESLKYATAYSAQVRADYQTYCRAYDRGAFERAR